MEGDSYEAFSVAHDKLVDKKRGTENEDVQGIYAKARGYIARLAMILEALELAMDRVCNSQSPTQWTTSVKQSSVLAAEAIIEHLNNQKLILMGLKDQGILSTSFNSVLYTNFFSSFLHRWC